MEAWNQIRDTLADFTVLWWDCQKQPLSLKKLFSKSSRYPQEITVLEPLFKNVTGLKACNFIEKSLQHRCFHENIAKFLVLLFSKNICKRLLFDFFNGSLLHGPKGSRSRLYDASGFRVWDTGLDFCFYIGMNRVHPPTCVRKFKTNTFDESIKFLNWLFLVVLDSFRSL